MLRRFLFSVLACALLSTFAEASVQRVACASGTEDDFTTAFNNVSAWTQECGIGRRCYDKLCPGQPRYTRAVGDYNKQAPYNWYVVCHCYY